MKRIILLLLCLWGTVSAQERERELGARMVFIIRHANRENLEERPYEPVRVVVRQPRTAASLLLNACCKPFLECFECLSKPCFLYERPCCRNFLTCGNRVSEANRAECVHLFCIVMSSSFFIYSGFK